MNSTFRRARAGARNKNLNRNAAALDILSKRGAWQTKQPDKQTTPFPSLLHTHTPQALFKYICIKMQIQLKTRRIFFRSLFAFIFACALSGWICGISWFLTERCGARGAWSISAPLTAVFGSKIKMPLGSVTKSE